MDRVIFPHRAIMEHAMDPVEKEIRNDQKDHGLRPERQLAERPKTSVVESDQRIVTFDIIKHARANNQQADPYDARHQRNSEPVNDVRYDFALAPPWLARIARPEMRQHRKDDAERDRHREDLCESFADDMNDGEKNGHGAALLKCTAIRKASNLKGSEQKTGSVAILFHLASNPAHAFTLC